MTALRQGEKADRVAIIQEDWSGFGSLRKYFHGEVILQNSFKKELDTLTDKSKNNTALNRWVDGRISLADWSSTSPRNQRSGRSRCSLCSCHTRRFMLKVGHTVQSALITMINIADGGVLASCLAAVQQSRVVDGGRRHLQDCTGPAMSRFISLTTQSLLHMGLSIHGSEVVTPRHLTTPSPFTQLVHS